MDLRKLAEKLVVLLPGDEGAAVDLYGLRKATGLPLVVTEKELRSFGSDGRHLRFGISNRQGKFLSTGHVEQMLDTWRRERYGLSRGQHDALHALLRQMLALAENSAPRTFGSKPFRLASANRRSEIARSLALARWGHSITGEAVRMLHARMLAGDTQAQAAAAAGVSATAASLIRRRLYDAWTDEIEAAWQAGFGAQPLGAPAKRVWSLSPGKRDQRDTAAAMRLRQVYALLHGAEPLTQIAAAKELGLTRSRIAKVICRDPSKWGPKSALAWRQTFGAPAKGPKRPTSKH